MAECTGWVVLVDFATGKPVDLENAGEPYDRLYAFIAETVEKSACEVVQ